jgi:hypothetical protein
MDDDGDVFQNNINYRVVYPKFGWHLSSGGKMSKIFVKSIKNNMGDGGVLHNNIISRSSIRSSDGKSIFWR